MLDTDDLNVNVHLRPTVSEIKAENGVGRRDPSSVSGLNPADSEWNQLGACTPQASVGTCDHLFSQVCTQVHAVQEPRTETFRFEKVVGERKPKRHLGMPYFRLNLTNRSAEFRNPDSMELNQWQPGDWQQFGWIRFEEFAHPEHIVRLRRREVLLKYRPNDSRASARLVHAVGGCKPPPRGSRVARLASELVGSDFDLNAIHRVAHTGVH